MSNYNNYVKFKQDAYYTNVSFKKWIIEFSPLMLVQLLFPVSRFFKKNETVLDVGSGSGIYSYILRKKFHCTVISVEPFMKDLYGNSVVKSNIFDMKHSRRYSSIYLIDVLEHFDQENARKLLISCFTLLSPSGRLFVKVPNCGSFLALESHFGDITHQSAYSYVGLNQLILDTVNKPAKNFFIGPNLTFNRLIASIFSIPISIILYLLFYSNGLSWSRQSIGLIAIVSND